MKRLSVGLLTVFCAAVICFGICGIRAYAADSEEVVPVYRLYNETNLEHLYTSNPNERQMCINAGWKDEGIGWYAPARSNWPVRRLYHAPTGYHLYSQNPVEMDMLVAAGWKLEGIGFYSSEKKAVEVRRQFNPVNHMHNYSYNPAEIEFLGANGWKLEGTAWYACTPPSQTKKPDTKESDTKQSETKQPETKQPETKQPETKQPETKQPETKEPEPVDDRAEALAWAKNYLKEYPYSAYELRKAMKGTFTDEGIAYAIENCGADWDINALARARIYLKEETEIGRGCSYYQMYEHLRGLDNGCGFTNKQAEFAALNCGANWYDQAALAAAYEYNMSPEDYPRWIDLAERLWHRGFGSSSKLGLPGDLVQVGIERAGITFEE